MRGSTLCSPFQMATLNVAEHFRLEGLLGGIGPGKCADMVLIPDLRTVEGPVRGEQREGDRPGRKAHGSTEEGLCMRAPGLDKRRFSPQDFAIRVNVPGSCRCEGDRPDHGTRDQGGSSSTCRIQEGQLKADPKQDILKASVISCEGRIFNALIRGHGFQRGAMATSGAWETFAVVVVGDE
jgi:adenine deaminase